MAEIRCQMCGKPNPADLEVCQFCHARLKPQQAFPSPGGRSAASGRDDDEIPDWLRSLRRTDEPEPEDSGELPDWLKPAQPEQPAGEKDAGAADWLSGLRDDSDLGSPAEKDAPAAEEQEELWEAEPAQADDMPDWLAAMRADEPERPGRGEAQQEDAGPAWLDELQAMREPDEPSGAAPADEAQAAQAEGLGEDFDIPDWLSGIEPAAGDSPAAGDEAEPAGELPGWLAAGEEPGQTGAQVFDLGEEAEPAGELPDWLAAAAEEAPQQEQAATQAFDFGEEAELSGELPDWLAAAAGEAPEQEQAGVQAFDFGEEAEQAGELPDWLAAAAGESPEQGQAGAKIYDLEEEPDWLAQFGSSQVEQASEPEAPPEAEPVAEPQALPEAEPEPDWLAKLDLSPSGEDEVGAGLGTEPEPDWLASFNKAEEDAAQAAGDQVKPVSPFTASDEEDDALGLLDMTELPDWLSDVKPREEPAAESEEAPALEPADDAPHLAPAELPTWLAAMRPVDVTGEDLGGETIIGEVEGAGPLSGLRGVLPAEPDITRVGKPGQHIYKLQVPEAQQAQAELFRQLIDTEGEAPPIPSRFELSPQHLLRIMIALALALIALGSFFLPELTSSPAAIDPGVSASNQVINGLPAGAPVLVAVDFEPGWSGEMDAAASAVIDHLLLRGTFLTLVSTSPTGPVQAERLMQMANTRLPNASGLSDQYANLGYIPGGPAGLLALATSPREVLPYGTDVAEPWGLAPLQQVDSLADFALVMVLTENPDTGRYWIEQVDPLLGDTPLLMVVSAQAGPLLQPYFQAQPRQLDGLIAGISGGAGYERLNGTTGLAERSRSAFSLGLLVAVLLIFLGGLLNAVMALVRSRRQRARAEARANAGAKS